MIVFLVLYSHINELEAGKNMKKILTSLGLLVLLSGCMEKPKEKTGNVPTRKAEQATEETTKETKANEDSELMVFVPQEADLDAGLTIENDETLSVLNEMVEEADVEEVGIEDDVAIQYTGIYFSDEHDVQPVFLLSNRTDQAYTNIDIAVSFGKINGESLFEEELFYLSEEEFGILEPGTIMPLYLMADPTKLELLEEISETREEEISIDSFDYDTVDTKL